MEKFNILKAIKEEAPKERVGKSPLKPEEFRRKKQVKVKNAEQLLEERKQRVRQKIESVRYKKAA